MKDKKQLEETLYEILTKGATPLQEVKNTYLADVNEILVGYYCAGENWKLFKNSSEAKKVLKKRATQIGKESFVDQKGRAQVQAEEIMDWAAANGWENSLTKVYWTARPGDLSRAVGVDVDQNKNPTDILLEFGPESFLGISSKSTKSKGDIGFKNPGLGTIGKQIGYDLKGPADELQDRLISKLDFGDAKSRVQRKAFLKSIAAGRKMTSVPELTPYYEGGREVLRKLRDTIWERYLDMPIEELKEHFINDWIDADDSMFPYYIKSTGKGKNGNYSSNIEDPLNNEKLKKLSSEHIELDAVSNNSIVVWAGEGEDAVKLFRVRLKWESAPLASSIKLSGDPG
jgi:hypothetical protein